MEKMTNARALEVIKRWRLENNEEWKFETGKDSTSRVTMLFLNKEGTQARCATIDHEDARSYLKGDGVHSYGSLLNLAGDGDEDEDWKWYKDKVEVYEWAKTGCEGTREDVEKWCKEWENLHE